MFTIYIQVGTRQQQTARIERYKCLMTHIQIARKLVHLTRCDSNVLRNAMFLPRGGADKLEDYDDDFGDDEDEDEDDEENEERWKKEMEGQSTDAHDEL